MENIYFTIDLEALENDAKAGAYAQKMQAYDAACEHYFAVKAAGGDMTDAAQNLAAAEEDLVRDYVDLPIDVIDALFRWEDATPSKLPAEPLNVILSACCAFPVDASSKAITAKVSI